MRQWIPATALLIVAGIVIPADSAYAQVEATRHNLSASGPGLVRAADEQEICIFCHAPHRARTDTGVLWNRFDPPMAYQTYQSSSLFAAVGQPTGASKLCLSCHDGTIALGAVVSRPAEIPFIGGIRFMPSGRSLLGTDLGDDHPVSFAYSESLALGNAELRAPGLLPPEVKLDGNGMLQCTACHDPHIDTFGNFLVMPLHYSQLCTACHNRADWEASAHATSPANWSGTGTNPWPLAEFPTVAENACQNCHRPHHADGRQNLLLYQFEEDNCLACHNGNVAATDIESELTKLYRHAVSNFVGVHESAESFDSPVTEHVECADCHDAHRVSDLPSSAPVVGGTQIGVSGISLSGVQVKEASFAYEICFKCHADNNVISFVDVNRQYPQINTRLEFDIANPSFHPVAGAGQNGDVPSLLPPMTTGSQVYCTDCHGNDSGSATGGPGPSGPHGSIFPYMLERNYTTLDNTIESGFEYALCYKCHDRDSILGDDSFSRHELHIRSNNTPCSACHDAHGVSATQGTFLNNSHLINFDLNIVSPNSKSLLIFEDMGTFRGQCYLSCHGTDHDPKTYP